MTIFDVVAFKMVTALASSTATAVTASDWESVITAMTGQVSVATIVGVLATVVCRYVVLRPVRSCYCRLYYAYLSSVRDRGAGD